jgi:hypothetical protein
MDCGHLQLSGVALAEQHDPFAAALGAGRGLSTAQRAEQAQADAEAKESRPFAETEENGVTVVSYFRDNNEATGILHREDGPARILTTAGGGRTEEYFLFGRLQRADGPARLQYYDDGTLAQQEWYRLGDKVSTRHRADGPAVITDDPGVGAHTEEGYCWGKRHCEDGPAHSVIADNGDTIISYYLNDQLDREDGPAVVRASRVGGGVTERWYHQDRLHRADGPAQITIFSDGRRAEYYYADGLKHRIGGPAFVGYHPDGTVAQEHWYRRGNSQSSSRLRRCLSSAGELARSCALAIVMPAIETGRAYRQGRVRRPKP